MTSDLEKELSALAERGLTFSDCVGFFAARQNPVEEAYAEAAKGYADEGTLEFDDAPIVSCDDPKMAPMSWPGAGWMPGKPASVPNVNNREPIVGTPTTASVPPAPIKSTPPKRPYEQNQSPCPGCLGFSE
jgi:hypothetical protein